MQPHEGDRAEIEQLLSLWGHLLDDREWERLEECVTDDAIYDGSVFGFEPVQGIGAIRAMLRDGEHAAAHHVTNILVSSPDPDGVRRVSSKGLGVMHDGTVRSVTYHDEIVGTAAGPRIARRSIAGAPQPRAGG